MKIPVNVIIHSQDLIRYIFTKLHAPAVLMYGTLLNDIRNSATDEYDPCLHINPFDHDIAIAVYPIHLQQIAAMKDQMYRYYRWEVVEQSIEMFQRGYLSLQRVGQPEFRIDFYAFHYWMLLMFMYLVYIVFSDLDLPCFFLIVFFMSYICINFCKCSVSVLNIQRS